MDIKSLLKEAFFTQDAKRATSAIEQARARVTDQAKVGASSLEAVVPKRPDEDWLRQRVLRPLIYFCQSTGSPPPSCTGVFVTFFYKDHLYCVLGAEVLSWASAQLQVDTQALTDRYGTGARAPLSSPVPA